jgi:hypothetical protein
MRLVAALRVTPPRARAMGPRAVGEAPSPRELILPVSQPRVPPMHVLANATDPHFSTLRHETTRRSAQHRTQGHLPARRPRRPCTGTRRWSHAPSGCAPATNATMRAQRTARRSLLQRRTQPTKYCVQHGRNERLWRSSRFMRRDARSMLPIPRPQSDVQCAVPPALDLPGCIGCACSVVHLRDERDKTW